MISPSSHLTRKINKEQHARAEAGQRDCLRQLSLDLACVDIGFIFSLNVQEDRALITGAWSFLFRADALVGTRGEGF